MRGKKLGRLNGSHISPCLALAYETIIEQSWTAVEDVAELIETLPGLMAYRPHLRYFLLDEGRLGATDLEPIENLAAALMRLENSRAPHDL